MALDSQNIVQLPNPRFTGPLAVEQALLARRSVREFRRNALALNEVSQILWAAQGITDSGAIDPRWRHGCAGTSTRQTRLRRRCSRFRVEENGKP
jgi:nitroreductase